MIGSAETAAAVAERLARPDLAGTPVVFDPVMIATSGAALAGPDPIRAFHRLLDICTVATPNIDELPAPGGEAAFLPPGCALLAKGGPAAGAPVTTPLFQPHAGPFPSSSPSLPAP